jgi:hypothetical protein
MPKKCIICGGEAKYLIKGTSDYYCAECAEESFSDLSLLQTVEEKAKQESAAVDEEIDEEFDEDKDDETDLEEE